MAALLICAGAIPFILLTALVAYNIEFNYFEPKAALKSYALAIDHLFVVLTGVFI